ncbi:hypothetical protein NQ317_001256, partial [Molorchus minor]
VVYCCLLAIAAAKPDVPAPESYTSHVAVPNGYSYLNYVAGTPLAYSAIVTPSVPTVPSQVVQKSQYHAQDQLGQASYGHSEPLQTHNAVQDAAGNKVGSFSYIAPDGRILSTSYVADALGYRVATNSLPVDPNVLPVAPLDTPEVAAARIAHLKEHEVVKSRTRRSVAVAAPVTYSYVGLTYPVPALHPANIPVAYSKAIPRSGNCRIQFCIN